MMVRALKLAAVLPLFFALVGCESGSPRGSTAQQRRDLDDLASAMIGSFSSADQHAADAENYLDIRLEMARIWPRRTDGYWLYVEQAVATELDKPYRQRIYHLSARPEGTLESSVFTLAEPEKALGAWKNPSQLANVSPTNLTRSDGCSIVLHRSGDGSFTGGTEGMGCASNLRGAVYATSTVTIFPDRMITWDRGFDSGGNQVWGVANGGYVFVKQPHGK